MVHTPAFMKKTLLSLSVASLSVISSQALAEQTPLKQAYQEPTRGFFLEHGTTSGSGKASVELHTGSDGLNSGGGIRLGLTNSEIIINSGLNEYDNNSILVKWGLPRQSSDGKQQTPLIWSGLLGVGHTNIEDDNNRYERTSFTFGIAATIKADAGLFTASPKLVYSDGSGIDSDTFLELDLGAYVGIIEMDSGLFSVGAEALITTADDTDNTIALGARWLYNEHVNLDIVPFVFSDADLIGVPGLVRLNMAF